MASRKEQRLLKQKRAKQMKIFVISLCAAIGLALIFAIVFTVLRNAGTEVYTDGTAAVTLNADGSYTAALYHNESFRGSYTKQKVGSETTVTFLDINGAVYTGYIEGNTFHLPEEWGDDHGHASSLRKK